jgi:hypothetical protein
MANGLKVVWSLLNSLSTTMSHWSRGLTVCFPRQGAAFVPRGATYTLELGYLIVPSRYISDPDVIPDNQPQLQATD